MEYDGDYCKCVSHPNLSSSGIVLDTSGVVCVIIFVVMCIYCCVHLLCQNILRMLVASIHFTTLSPLRIMCHLSYDLCSGDYIHVCMYVFVHVHKHLWVCACMHICTPRTCSCLCNRFMREHAEMLGSTVFS